MAKKVFSLEMKNRSQVRGIADCDTRVKNKTTASYHKLLDGLKPIQELVLVAPMQVPESIFDLAIAKKAGYFNYPPVGLLYIASVAKQADPNIKIKLIDLNFEMLKNSHKEKFSYDF